MKVFQLTPSLSFGDAVSNDILAMSDVLDEMGIKNEIVCIAASDKVKSRCVFFPDVKFSKNDIIIYHMSIGSQLTDIVLNAQVYKKIMVYHNITPAHFFKGNDGLLRICASGRQQLKPLSYVMDLALCDSDYNAKELIDLGYKNVQTLPIIFNKNEYLETKPSQKILNKYDDLDVVNILFVGRIAQNKKQEDVISAFHLYNKYINPKSRLFLVGSSVGNESYQQLLEKFIRDRKIKNVIFSGHISFPDIIAYYKASDVFLCQSEHEGFCVPLLEAMLFNVPIIAYDSCAVPDTLGESGIVFTKKNQELVAELINAVVTKMNFRMGIIKKQRERLEFFDEKKTKEKFRQFIEPLIK